MSTISSTFAPSLDLHSVLVLDGAVGDDLVRQRRERGQDRHDEVWEGVYHLAPLANDEHQGLATLLAAVFCSEIDFKNTGWTRAGVNVSDRRSDWTDNFRCPDVAVFLAGTSAANCGTFWLGGPDFAVEIVSPNDRTREKLDFYAQVGTRELLIVDREPWQLELLRLQDGKLVSVGVASPTSGTSLVSDVVPFGFALTAAAPRPILVVQHAGKGQLWQL